MQNVNEQNIGRPLKIFSLESDDFFRNFLHDIMLVHVLQETDFNVESNVEDAINFLENSLPQKPDIIFLCLNAPLERGGKIRVLSGMEVLKTLRADEHFKKVPIIIFSAYSEKSIRRKAIEFGATKYLIKGEVFARDIGDIVRLVISPVLEHVNV